MALDQSKPHKGRIVVDFECPTPGRGLGYMLCGTFLDHELFAGREGHTSWVIARDGDEVETRNSRYTVVRSEDHVGVEEGA